jgi:chitin disaccharide deacetylase
MANGDALQDAFATVKDLPALGVGVHLVLTELRPVAPARAIPGLVNGAGRLPPTPGVLFRAVLQGVISRRAMETELEWQVLKILDEGLLPTHLDTHKHVHVLPAVLDCVLHVAQKYGIRWIRNPFDETSVVNLLPTVAGKDRLALFRQFLKTRTFSVFRSRFACRLRSAGLRSPDHFFGTVITGLWKEASLRQLVSRLPDGINELMTHPGECDAELHLQSTRLRESREQERDILLAPTFRDLLQTQQIILTHYGEHAR